MQINTDSPVIERSIYTNNMTTELSNLDCGSNNFIGIKLANDSLSPPRLQERAQIRIIRDGNQLFYVDITTGEIMECKILESYTQRRPAGIYPAKTNDYLLKMAIDELPCKAVQLLRLISERVGIANKVTLNMFHEAKQEGMAKSTYSNALTKLKKLDLVREDGDTLLIHPAYSYKGSVGAQENTIVRWLVECESDNSC